MKKVKITNRDECKKCGYDEFDFKFIPNKEIIETLDGRNCEVRTMEDEYILVTCKNCGFKEKEATLDSDEE